MWYIWTAPDSPLYGRSKMATFERYFLADKSMHHESKNAYYHLFDKEETADNILKEFGLTGGFCAYHQWSCTGRAHCRRKSGQV